MTAKKQHTDGAVQRQSYLERAYDAAEYTLPTLYRRTAHNGPNRSSYSEDMETPFQSIGARGVQNLGAKLLLTILPPGQQWVKLSVNETALDNALAGLDIPAEENKRVKTEFEGGLTSVSNELHSYVDSNPGIRVRAHETIRDMLVGGTALWHVTDDGKGRVFHLGEFTMRRNYVGDLTGFTIEERIVRGHDTPERVLRLLKKGEKEAMLYTVAELREDGKWEVRQEINDTTVEGTEGTFTQENFPYIDAMFEHISGEDYGRSYVEFLMGDLRSAEGLSQAVVEGAALASRMIPLVSPNSTIKPSELARTPNGQPISGEEGDISFMTVGKGGDFSFALAALDKIERRLELAFLMNTGVQRKGERVTATEIEALVRELSDTLGGVYSHLAASIQVPLVGRLMSIMRSQNLLPQLPNDLIQPSVVAGLENVGRGRELQGLTVALQSVQGIVGPEAVVAQINPEELLRRALVDAGVEPRGLLKTPQQIAEEQQAAQQAQAAQDTLPELVKGAVNQPQPVRGEPSGQ